MKSSGSRPKGIVPFMIISALVLAGGIFLILSAAKEDGQVVWKTIVGWILAFFGGILLLSMGAALVAAQPGKKEPHPKLTDPLGELRKGGISQARYDAIRRKETAALAGMVALAVALLAAWFNLFSLLLAISMAAGAAGALLLHSNGKNSLWLLSLFLGGVTGLAAALFSRPDNGKRYAYFINGFKVGEGNGGISGFLSAFLGCALLCAALTLAFAYMITMLCSVLTRTNP